MRSCRYVSVLKEVPWMKKVVGVRVGGSQVKAALPDLQSVSGVLAIGVEGDGLWELYGERAGGRDGDMQAVLSWG